MRTLPYMESNILNAILTLKGYEFAYKFAKIWKKCHQSFRARGIDRPGDLANFQTQVY